jgi:hypothetical protein
MTDFEADTFARKAVSHVWTAPLAQEGKIGDAASVGCGHVSGLLTRRLWPLALMKSADWVPISLSRMKRLRHCGLIRSPARPVRHHLSPPLHSPRLAY